MTTGEKEVQPTTQPCSSQILISPRQQPTLQAPKMMIKAKG